jgi:hypothetical protein
LLFSPDHARGAFFHFRREGARAIRPDGGGDAIRYATRLGLTRHRRRVRRRTFIDNYRTPHTPKLHVVERPKLTDGSKAIDISLRWTIRERSRPRGRRRNGGRRSTAAPMGENLCNENNEDILNRYGVPNPRADKSEF